MREGRIWLPHIRPQTAHLKTKHTENSLMMLARSRTAHNQRTIQSNFNNLFFLCDDNKGWMGKWERAMEQATVSFLLYIIHSINNNNHTAPYNRFPHPPPSSLCLPPHYINAWGNSIQIKNVPNVSLLVREQSSKNDDRFAQIINTFGFIYWIIGLSRTALYIYIYN